MSSWPPNPNTPQQTPDPQPPHPQLAGQEWRILEKTLLASIEEQRRARRWSIFFKLTTFFFFLLFFFALAKSCGKEENIAVNTSPHLGIVDITGEIGEGKPANSDDIITALNAAFDASQSKAIVLNINSPGGSPVESDQIWQEIRRLRELHKDKKVYAVIGDMGASGAYYIASAADEIYVNPSSLVGSIGVIMPNYGVTGLAQKLGVEDRTMTAGAHKNILSMTKPLDPFEKAHVQGVLDNVHQHFIAAVKEGRGKRLKEDANTFSGLFWSGEQAINLGLADKAGSVDSLKRELKLKDTADYSVDRSSLEKIMGRLGTTLGVGIGASLKSSVSDMNSQASLK
ncbi:signal peptide peptidase SppA [Aquirhabdus sp.]|uniref:signal peptide peptidase SppA n=1 Tax=Aquirhabdus sp. TaxID=2824160 RepID=UPI00396C3BB1